MPYTPVIVATLVHLRDIANLDVIVRKTQWLASLVAETFYLESLITVTCNRYTGGCINTTSTDHYSIEDVSCYPGELHG